MALPGIMGLPALLLAASAATAVATHCDLAVVGAGAGGAYAAWRAAASGRRTCVFEMASRPGGRIHSLRRQGPQADLVVEAGAYRFAPKPVVSHFKNTTWRIDTPLTAAIVKELGLHTADYNPDPKDWDHGMHKLVDVGGQDIGYLTLVETMLERAEASGAAVRYTAKVVGLASTAENGGLVTLRLQTGEEVLVNAVILNLPQSPAIELLRRSSGAIASRFPKPLYDPVAFPIMKLYVHYDDAWWRNDLGLVAGAFHNTEPQAVNNAHTPGVPTELPAPLQGQYHDGDIRCDLPGGKCRGYLQAFYGGDNAQAVGGVDGAIKFYSPFMDPVSTDSVQQIGNSQPHHRVLLEDLHAALLSLHKSALDAVNATAKVKAMRPTGAVLSIWSQGVQGIHAGCHTPKRNMTGAPAIPGMLSKEALEPLPGLPIFVANEAFGPMMCFAEGSLAMAEAALQKLNVTLPPSGWLSKELVASLLDPEMANGRPPMDPFLLSPGSLVRQQSQSTLGVVV